jgi:FkbM family methyltransferase
MPVELVGKIPLSCFAPFRKGAVALKRGTLGRSFCIGILKYVKDHYALSERLSEIRPLDMPDLSFRSVNSPVLDAVYWFGVQGYEGRVADVWVTLCAQARSVLEIGGNIGLFTVIGARATSGRYTVLEPVPAVADELRENLRRNGITSVEVMEAAAIPGQAARDAKLWIPSEGRAAPVGAYLAEGSEVTDRTSTQIISVKGAASRTLFEGRDLIKIDAEGIEFELLASVQDLMVASKPTLLIEILPEAKKLGRFLSELAADVGYDIYVLPEYGSNKIVSADVGHFTSSVPQRFNSKDVVLSVKPIS